MATKYSLAEQVLLRLKNGRPDMATGVDIRDIIEASEQVISEVLQMSHFQNMQNGETIPAGTSLATYENIPVETKSNRSVAKIPVVPMYLPRNMGVFAVYLDGKYDCPAIPLQTGQWNLIKCQGLINGLAGNTGYELYGREILFTHDIKKGGVDKVTLLLAVTDLSKISDFEPLPLPKNYEAGVADRLFEIFVNTGIADNNIDVTNENKNRNGLQ
ncbi:hypothetical protein [Polluticaenibacter yanchengensis]|uniref:Phage protein Gp138 N-terminal domain-containing protein n=1 Tax=Polluticaenibacter yanchengensis TaxID=3014562 RepID=A0ABT4UIQ5_9BACT|nr:hypothetical protein [Chitinophagaceae bacterium LY-5]